MDIKNFVAQTLKEIQAAIQGASDGDNQYYLDNSTSKGVHFDLAVTSSETKESSGHKKGGLYIKVVGAEVGGAKKEAVISEYVSRIQFNIKKEL